MNGFEELPPVGVLGVTVRFALTVLVGAMLLAVTRVVRGPSLPDRVVAIDLVATLIVGIIAIYSIDAGEPILLRVAIVMALITFLGTIAFAFYIEKGGTT